MPLPSLRVISYCCCVPCVDASYFGCQFKIRSATPTRLCRAPASRAVCSASKCREANHSPIAAGGHRSATSSDRARRSRWRTAVEKEARVSRQSSNRRCWCLVTWSRSGWTTWAKRWRHCEATALELARTGVCHPAWVALAPERPKPSRNRAEDGRVSVSKEEKRGGDARPARRTAGSD